MITIQTEIKKDGVFIGSMALYMSEVDFNAFILDTIELGKKSDGDVIFRDLNGNAGENFTIPE